MSAFFRAITYVCAAIATIIVFSEDGKGGPGLFTFWGGIVFIFCCALAAECWGIAKLIERHDAEQAAK